jgi:hypothetical protein
LLAALFESILIFEPKFVFFYFSRIIQSMNRLVDCNKIIFSGKREVTIINDSIRESEHFT